MSGYTKMETVAKVLSSNCRTESAYMNLGLIEGEFTDYVDAAAALVRRVAHVAGLSSSTRSVIDVGCGYADQDMIFVKEFHVQHVKCVDIIDSHVRIARQRISDIGLSHRIQIEHGDAAMSMNTLPSSVDVVVSIDAALHLPSRESFFKLAYEALVVGGRLALSDQILKKGHITADDAPNDETIERYVELLRVAGFHSIITENITSKSYTLRHPHASTPPVLHSFVEEYGFSIVGQFLGIQGYNSYDMFLISATK